MPIPYDLVRRPGKEAPEERPLFPVSSVKAPSIWTT